MTNRDTAATTFQELDINRDGINAVDLGVVGSWQFSLSTITLPNTGRRIAASVYRRRADERGTYGGWRFESMSTHPGQHANAGPDMEELARRIELWLASRPLTALQQVCARARANGALVVTESPAPHVGR